MSEELLDQLVGLWNLTGTMGTTVLRQKVAADWVIQGHFLQAHFIHEEPILQDRSRYEAIYMLGYDTKSGKYSLHLFDTFGAGYAQTVGVGLRHGDSIEFLFEYPNGLFSNTFTWNREIDGWEMLLRQMEEGGGWKTFARKSLTRSRVEDR